VSGKRSLAVEDIRAGYGKKQVVFGVSLSLEPGQIVAILGHNGAGKTTTLKTIAGLLPAQSGVIRLDGVDITRNSCAQRVRHGIVYLPQERSVFAQLSVHDNLLLGGTPNPDRAERQKRLDYVLELFPILGERRSQMAGTLSGGEQRMVAFGIALMASARVLLLDEYSLGLAPSLCQALAGTIKLLVERDGMSVLLVEQNVPLALSLAERVSVMRMGRIVVEETTQQLGEREHLWELF